MVLYLHRLDFVRCDCEMDRWLAVIQGAGNGTCVRPLELAANGAIRTARLGVLRACFHRTALHRQLEQLDVRIDGEFLPDEGVLVRDRFDTQRQ